MTILATCAACGQDCTYTNITYRGEIYHAMCIPYPPKRPSSNLQSAHDRINLRRARESRKPYKDDDE